MRRMDKDTWLSEQSDRLRCLKCGTMLDGHTDAGSDGAKPGPGHIALCFSCGHAMQFAEDDEGLYYVEVKWEDLPKETVEEIRGYQTKIAIFRIADLEDGE